MSTQFQDYHKSKSPYKTLFSSSKMKVSGDTTRRVYLNDFKNRGRNVEMKKYHSSSRNAGRDLTINFSQKKQLANSQ